MTQQRLRISPSLTSNTQNPIADAAASRGVFILFEGLDRSGKTTQCKLLYDYINNKNKTEKRDSAVHLRFPSRSTPIGQMINAYLTNKASTSTGNSSSNSTSIKPSPDLHSMHLLFSANRWEYHQLMLDSLTHQQHLIVDRYSPSGIVYTVASSNNQLSVDWCRSADCGLIEPDVIFYLSVSEDVVEQRGGFGTERYETKDMQQRVRTAFQRLIERDRERAEKQGKAVKWIEIDGSRGIDEIQAEIRQHADRIIEAASNLAIEYIE